MVKTHEYFKTPKQKFKEPDRIVSVCKVAGKNLWYYTVMRAFKDFDSVGDCLKEHERLFQKPGYKDAWPCRKDPFKFAQKICDGGRGASTLQILRTSPPLPRLSRRSGGSVYKF